MGYVCITWYFFKFCVHEECGWILLRNDGGSIYLFPRSCWRKKLLRKAIREMWHHQFSSEIILHSYTINTKILKRKWSKHWTWLRRNDHSQTKLVYLTWLRSVSISKTLLLTYQRFISKLLCTTYNQDYFHTTLKYICTSQKCISLNPSKCLNNILKMTKKIVNSYW